MKKKIELEISNCGECPYAEYDSHYGMSYDSGWDCGKLDFRIKDDSDGTIILGEFIDSRCPLPSVLSATLKKL